MLKVVPDGIFSRNFTVYNNGESVAIILPALMREKGELVFNGTSYRVYREGLLSGAFILEKEGTVISSAVKPDILFRSYMVKAGEKVYALKAESVFGRRFLLFDEDRIIGSVQPENAFTRRGEIDLPDYIEPVVRIFMIWLVLISWKRDSAE